MTRQGETAEVMGCQWADKSILSNITIFRSTPTMNNDIHYNPTIFMIARHNTNNIHDLL